MELLDHQAGTEDLQSSIPARALEFHDFFQWLSLTCWTHEMPPHTEPSTAGSAAYLNCAAAKQPLIPTKKKKRILPELPVQSPCLGHDLKPAEHKSSLSEELTPELPPPSSHSHSFSISLLFPLQTFPNISPSTKIRNGSSAAHLVWSPPAFLALQKDKGPAQLTRAKSNNALLTRAS